MLFVLTPQNPSSVYYDPEEAFAAFQRRQYIAALQEQQQRAQFERELAVEQERHRIALASITQQEAARRQRQAAAARFSQCGQGQCGQGQRRACQPDPEEILARRLAREQEEQRRSRQFHEHILSQIFGVATGETSEQAAPAEASQPSTSKSADKGKQSTAKRPFDAPEPEPHWSAAPQRARALAEITSIHRTFASLKNTFVFPSDTLERLPGSDLPRLAYNATNASIHSYEHALSELLTKLDGIESHGFKGVREARKQLVVRIGKELEALETKISERLAGAASPAVVSVPVPEVQQKEVEHVEHVEDVVMNDEQTTSTDAAPAGYDVEPVEPVEIPQTLSPVVNEPTADTTAVSQTMDVEPVEAPLPVLVPAEKDALPRPSSPVPTLSANVDQAAPSEDAESTIKAASAVLLETSSDEESEIEDAVHIIIDENDEVVSHDQRRAEASDQEVEYELI